MLWATTVLTASDAHPDGHECAKGAATCIMVFPMPPSAPDLADSNSEGGGNQDGATWEQQYREEH